jgi:hypothetical protein
MRGIAYFACLGLVAFCVTGCDVLGSTKLKPPYRRMLATFNYFDLTFHRALDSIDARQIGQAKRPARRLNFLGRRIHSRAKKLGLRTCARV